MVDLVATPIPLEDRIAAVIECIKRGEAVHLGHKLVIGNFTYGEGEELLEYIGEINLEGEAGNIVKARAQSCNALEIGQRRRWGIFSPDKREPSRPELSANISPYFDRITKREKIPAHKIELSRPDMDKLQTLLSRERDCYLAYAPTHESTIKHLHEVDKAYDAARIAADGPFIGTKGELKLSPPVEKILKAVRKGKRISREMAVNLNKLQEGEFATLKEAVRREYHRYLGRFEEPPAAVAEFQEAIGKCNFLDFKSRLSVKLKSSDPIKPGEPNADRIKLRTPEEAAAEKGAIEAILKKPREPRKPFVLPEPPVVASSVAEPGAALPVGKPQPASTPPVKPPTPAPAAPSAAAVPAAPPLSEKPAAPPAKSPPAVSHAEPSAPSVSKAPKATGDTIKLPTLAPVAPSAAKPAAAAPVAVAEQSVTRAERSWVARASESVGERAGKGLKGLHAGGKFAIATAVGLGALVGGKFLFDQSRQSRKLSTSQDAQRQ